MTTSRSSLPAHKNLLKACPFCGGHDVRPAEIVDSDKFYQCHDCTTTGPNGADWESATLQWNDRRTPEPWVPQEHTPKRKPCLRCEKPFMTTPERRICPECAIAINHKGLNTGYESRGDAQ